MKLIYRIVFIVLLAILTLAIYRSFLQGRGAG